MLPSQWCAGLRGDGTALGAKVLQGQRAAAWARSSGRVPLLVVIGLGCDQRPDD